MVVPLPACTSWPLPEIALSVTASLRLTAQRSVVHDRAAAERAGRAAIADLQRAGADRGRAGVGVGAGEGRRAAARLGHGAGAADRVADGVAVAAVEDQGRRC